MSTNPPSYTICSAPIVYSFVYILIETRIAPLNGGDDFDFTENKKIINEALKFIHLSKFEWCYV